MSPSTQTHTCPHQHRHTHMSPSTQTHTCPPLTQTHRSPINTDTHMSPINTVTHVPINTDTHTCPPSTQTHTCPPLTQTHMSPINTDTHTYPPSTQTHTHMSSINTDTHVPINIDTHMSPLTQTHTCPPSIQSHMSPSTQTHTHMSSINTDTQVPHRHRHTQVPINTDTHTCPHQHRHTHAPHQHRHTHVPINTDTHTGPINTDTHRSPIDTDTHRSPSTHTQTCLHQHRHTHMSPSTQTHTCPPSTQTHTCPHQHRHTHRPHRHKHTHVPINTDTHMPPINTDTHMSPSTQTYTHRSPINTDTHRSPSTQTQTCPHQHRHTHMSPSTQTHTRMSPINTNTRVPHQHRHTHTCLLELLEVGTRSDWKAPFTFIEVVEAIDSCVVGLKQDWFKMKIVLRACLLAVWIIPLLADNLCCSYPCLNGGVCMTDGFDDYICDCSNIEYYGKNCQTPTLWKRVKLLLKPPPDVLHHLLVNYKWLWDIVNSITAINEYVMRKVYLMRGDMIDSPSAYTSEHEYITLDANQNMSFFSRALPPVPVECPTPVGVWGKKTLPDSSLLVKKFFVRTKFRPDPMGTNAMFAFFAQHFTHQFFKTDLKLGPGFQWGGHGVDVTHVYGKNKTVEHMLRSFENGKLKSQLIDDEEWPLHLADLPVPMAYPPNIPDESKFALGHEFFGLLPGLFMYSTIWLREHNRVCDLLRVEHPEWQDEQIFQTAKLVVLGETIKIVIEDYVQHLSNYHFRLSFKPHLLFGESFQFQNRISVEFNHLYHWHPLMPDTFNISATQYSIKDFVFHPELVLKHGMKAFVHGLNNQRAGQMSHHNHSPMTLKVIKEAIEHGRQLRFQPLNQYRKRFGLKPYTSFQDLTGEDEMASELEELYGDVNAVEFSVGLFIEKRREKAMFGSSIVEIGGPFSVKGLMSNPICSPKYWRPSTFGGQVMFDMMNSASLQKLFCDNIKGDCPKVSFRVPDYVEGDTELSTSCSKEEL
ncbi:hypothetical protein ScPMuIL_010284 [Solemya velum]